MSVMHALSNGRTGYTACQKRIGDGVHTTLGGKPVTCAKCAESVRVSGGMCLHCNRQRITGFTVCAQCLPVQS